MSIFCKYTKRKLNDGTIYPTTDRVAPATGHPECKRENGFTVPGFVR